MATILEQREVENDRNEIKRMRTELEAERIRKLQDTPSKAVAASLRTMNIGPIEPLRLPLPAQPSPSSPNTFHYDIYTAPDNYEASHQEPEPD